MKYAYFLMNKVVPNHLKVVTDRKEVVSNHLNPVQNHLKVVTDQLKVISNH